MAKRKPKAKARRNAAFFGFTLGGCTIFIDRDGDFVVMVEAGMTVH